MNFFTETIMQDPRFTNLARCHDVNLLEPTTRKVALDIISDAARLDITIEIWETFRSQTRQEALFLQGATKLRRVGVHHYGLAFDVVKWVGGEPSWKGDWLFLRDLAKNYGFITGYDWGHPQAYNSFVDAGHVQRISTGDQIKLFAGTWYPSEAYII